MGNAEEERALREQRLGPVVRRRHQMRPETTDQRLLDTQGATHWVHEDPFRVMRIQSEFVEGFGTLAELGRAISVFGSARTPEGSPEYEAGVRIGRALAEAGFGVITGGGPGCLLYTSPRPRDTR
ncbi:TIGR00730 family Rossman fold protein, partial [Streptomyces albiflaviniger]|nr:TIGR00730 family Rossman fold protein [Streptomyces albiflaviniger]